MEDVAFNAYLYYHGRYFEAMKEDCFRFFPYYDPTKDTWAIKNPGGLSPTLMAQVQLTNNQQIVIDVLKEELQQAGSGGD